MTQYSKQLIHICDDMLIELHHNPLVSKQPYLLKIFSYNNCDDYRLSSNDLLRLSEAIADFLFDNPNNIGYDDNYTGLVRLWHHRRNEALNQIQKLQDQIYKYEKQNNCDR